jgi:hypothetical protein
MEVKNPLFKDDFGTVPSPPPTKTTTTDGKLRSQDSIISSSSSTSTLTGGMAQPPSYDKIMSEDETATTNKVSKSESNDKVTPKSGSSDIAASAAEPTKNQ